MKFDKNDKICLYDDLSASVYEKSSSYLFLTGVGMVLYPTKCFYKDIFREDIFLKLANNNDDVWFWAMLILNKIKIRLPYNNYKKINYIPNTQENGLWLSINKHGEGNEAFNRIMQAYPQIKKIMKEEIISGNKPNNNGQENQYKYAVSIIVPVYNMSKYLNRCLDSLVNQTLKEIEIICINDGSTDNSLEILNEYAKKDNRIIIINQRNKKLPTTRNVGIEKSTGEYIGFIDADDYIDLDFYEKLYKKAKTDNADIVRAPYYWIFPDGTKKPDSINKVILAKADNNETLNFNEHSGVVWNAIYNTDFIKRYNILFDIEDLKVEDIMFTAKCQLFSQKIKSINNAFYYYMQDNPYSEKTINLLKIKAASIIYLKLVNLLNISRLKKSLYNTEFKRAMGRHDYIFRNGLKVKDFNRKEKAKYLKSFCKIAKLYKKEHGRFEKLYPYDSIFQYIYDGDIHSYKNIVYNRKKSFIEKYIFSTYMEYRKKDKHRVINILGIKIKYNRTKF